MKKSDDSAESVQISKKYYIYPLIYSSVISIIFSATVFIQKMDIDTLTDFASQFYGIGITFSLTFIAFSITALALLQLLQSKDWFKEVSQSIYFKRFLKRFLHTAKYCIAFFVMILFFIIVNNFKDKTIIYSCLVIFLIFLLFIIFWTWNCITNFIKLFK